MLIGRTFRFFASSMTRSRRFQLSSAYQQRTSSASDVLVGLARSVKNPRAWLDQGSSGICVLVSHARDAGSDAEIQPAQTGSTMRARLKLLLTALKPCSPFFLA